MVDINFFPPEKDDIVNAAHRIAPYIRRTPVLTCDDINERYNTELFFKCENFQQAGSFKSRGACNNLLQLTPEERQRGVCTHSSGNHAAALARAAKLFGTKAFIVMPQNSEKVKIEAVRNYGGKIFFCEPILEAREAALQQIQQQTGAIEIHPYNNLRTITGQATACKELIEQCDDNLDLIIAPVGGGGLLSGTALSARYFGNNIRVIAGEPEGADDAAQSFYSGKLIPVRQPNTIADGLRTSLGSYTFPIIANYVYDIYPVSEEAIVAAMKRIFDKMKIVVEPSAAVALAVVMENVSKFIGKKTGIILSGGNIEVRRMAEILGG
ncbi:MAG: pyridoxal-phosphate dependent enzyme [Bacteroidales bacterium]|nr:pyridoxal-phosphate dependent enzyme [Bacteroidales bacterium]